MIRHVNDTPLVVEGYLISLPCALFYFIEKVCWLITLLFAYLRIFLRKLSINFDDLFKKFLFSLSNHSNHFYQILQKLDDVVIV